MPQRPSEVGARFAAGRAARGVTDAGMGLTPAQQILSDTPGTNDAPAPEPVSLKALPPALPVGASEIEEDQLRFILRTAIFERDQDLQRLAALAQARDRARDEWRAANNAVAEAETVLTEVRTHSRGHLIEAFIANQPTSGLTENHAKLELVECRDRLRHTEEIETALRDEFDHIENGLERRHYDNADAAGRLLSRSPEFIDLIQRKIYDSYSNLRDGRVLVADLQRLVHIDDNLMQLIDNNQPSDRSRRLHYRNDDAMITTWTTAISALLTNGDALLPGGSNRIPRDNHGNSNTSTNQPVRDGATSRQRARAARSSLAAPGARRKPAGSQTASSIRRTALARSRDPKTGKWLKGKAAEKTPPPE